MEYQIDGIPGFEGRKVVIASAGLISGAKLIVDHEMIKNRWGKYTLRRNDGVDIEARLRSNLIDPVPSLLIGGEKYLAVAPLKWYEMLWAGWPVALLFVGGALGALCGVSAAYINSHIFRSTFSPAMKYSITGLVSIVSILVYFIAAVVIYIVLHPNQ